MWMAATGQRIDNPIVNPVDLHGGMGPTGLLQYLDVEGRRLRVVRHGVRFVIFDESSLGVCGEAWCAEMSDGSFWWTARNLISGRWTGEPYRELVKVIHAPGG